MKAEYEIKSCGILSKTSRTIDTAAVQEITVFQN